MTGILARPRLFGLVCGAAAVALGMVYMAAAGAPVRYLFVNLAALVLGATAWLALGRTTGERLTHNGPAVIALAVPLLLTALLGVAVEGASRWVSIGSLNLQVSLIVLPLMIVLYARRPDALGTAGMLIAAFALAAQPDRAMAGVLVIGITALMLAERSRLATLALVGAVLSLGWTLFVPDALPAVPYVDRVLYTAFDVHALAGLAVVLGAAILIMPAIIGAARVADRRPVLLAVGGCWSGVVAAAALGNYPTPLVGYGGSAVLGYLLSVALLPTTGRELGLGKAAEVNASAGKGSDRTTSELRAAYMV